MKRMKRATVRVETNAYVVNYLQQLVNTELYGRNVGEAAERLICRALGDLLDEGIVLSVRGDGGNQE